MTKTIGLADDAYDALAGLKRPGESFSDLARRLASEKRRTRDLTDVAGTWPMSDEEYEEVVGELYRRRDASMGGRRFVDLS